MDDRAILVTGSTDGLGKRTAQALAAEGAAVLVHGRDPGKVEAARREIVDRGRGAAVKGYVADLSSLSQVHRLAEEVERDRDRLEVLVNNAGIFGTPSGRRELSEDGYELHFAVNYLAGFLLSALLLPLLRGSAPARIVNVTSGAQRAIDFDDVMLERRYDDMRAYSQSKLAQVMFTIELAERLDAEGAGVTVNCLHPASLMDTKMVRRRFWRTLTSVDEGAEATLRLIASPELEGVSGRYFEGRREAGAHGQAYDPAARQRLWALSEELTGVEAPSGARER
jgi:NAD(P)-dependent dehydrogenase (short-subunit alcohol dehydrogenase family)